MPLPNPKIIAGLILLVIICLFVYWYWFSEDTPTLTTVSPAVTGNITAPNPACPVCAKQVTCPTCPSQVACKACPTCPVVTPTVCPKCATCPVIKKVMVPAAADWLGRITTFTTLDVPVATPTIAYNNNQVLPINPAFGMKLVIDKVSDSAGKLLSTTLRMVPSTYASSVVSGLANITSKVGTVTGGLTAVYYPVVADATGVVTSWMPFTGLTNTATTFTYGGKVYPLSANGKILLKYPAQGATPESIRVAAPGTKFTVVGGVPTYTMPSVVVNPPSAVATGKSEWMMNPVY